jgi:hypothetical protein
MKRIFTMNHVLMPMLMPMIVVFVACAAASEMSPSSGVTYLILTGP